MLAESPEPAHRSQAASRCWADNCGEGDRHWSFLRASSNSAARSLLQSAFVRMFSPCCESWAEAMGLAPFGTAPAVHEGTRDTTARVRGSRGCPPRRLGAYEVWLPRRQSPQTSLDSGFLISGARTIREPHRLSHTVASGCTGRHPQLIVSSSPASPLRSSSLQFGRSLITATRPEFQH
jgi:hypothetical protein